MALARDQVYKALEVEKDDRGLERALNLTLGTLILANVAAVVLETVEDVYRQYALAFIAFEALSVAIFGTEYLLRVWSCTANPRYSHPVWGRVRYMATPLAIVDLLAIGPSLIPGGTLDLRFARAIRLLRLSRSLKFARYSESVRTLGRVVRSKRGELAVTAFLGVVLLVCASCGIYFVEHAAQPKAFSSVPAAMWWSVVTLTTVGYGDVYPVTVPGKLLAAVVAVLGIGLFALPTGILASGFSEELNRKNRRPRICPHCSKELPE